MLNVHLYFFRLMLMYVTGIAGKFWSGSPLIEPKRYIPPPHTLYTQPLGEDISKSYSIVYY